VSTLPQSIDAFGVSEDMRLLWVAIELSSMVTDVPDHLPLLHQSQHCTDTPCSYDDNEASSAPAPVHKESVAEPPPAPVETEYHPDEQMAPAADENGYGGEYHGNEEAYDDDDDDVDFNLGNGSGYAAAPKQEEDSTPTYQQFQKGPSTKGEDG
jgi:hypothetical protein